MNDEDEIISKLSSHLEAEKFRVEIAFGEVIQIFNDRCNTAKQQILSHLDNQLFNLRYNYRYYKEKLHKYYGKQTENEIPAFATERDIFSSINKCESAADLELLIRQNNDKFSENKLLESLSSSKTEGKSKILKKLKAWLKSQSELLPKTLFSDSMKSQASIEKLQTALTEFISEASIFENEIFQFSPRCSFATMDSRILTNPSDIRMIQNFISPDSSSITFKLLFRGTKHGFDSNSFYNHIIFKKNTLTLVRTSLGKVCGGFTTQNWHVVGGFKKDDNAFLFSVDRKMKFPVRSPFQAIYTNSNYMITFGQGHDLYIASGCNKNQISYSNLNVTYDASRIPANEVKSVLGGAYNFKVEELEIFEVRGYKKPKKVENENIFNLSFLPS